MNPLPSEILHSIFTRLDFRQRVVCFTVCLIWQTILDRYCLFYSVQLDESKAQFKKFIDLFENSPQYAAHVEELQFAFNIFNTEKNVDIFPTARFIKLALSDSRSFFSDYILFRDLVGIRSSNSKVEYLSHVFSCDLALQLITSNLCDRLETLDLYQFNTRDQAISQLKNLPVLKTFKLNVYQISINDIEVLHKNIPSIQDFVLLAEEILSNQETSDIIPTASLKTFVIKVTRFTNMQTHIRFYQYMVKKYANVLDIKCIDIALHLYDASWRRQVYSHGILDFIKLPTATNSGIFSLYDFPEGFNVFEILDSVDAQISDLHIDKCERKTLFKYLYESNQLQYIQKLKLESTDGETMDFIKAIPFLHTLNLSFSNTFRGWLSYPMNEFSLTGYVNQMNYIQNLHIHCGKLTQELANVIKLYFPNLINLSEATFHVEAVQGDGDGVLFNSANQAKVACYTCKPIVNTVVCSSLEEIKGLSCRLSIVSEMDKKLEILGSRAAAFKLINI